MKTAEDFLNSKGIKDTLYNMNYDIHNNEPEWIKGGLSTLLEEYTKQKQVLSDEDIDKLAKELIPDRKGKTPFGNTIDIIPSRERKAFIKGLKLNKAIDVDALLEKFKREHGATILGSESYYVEKFAYFIKQQLNKCQVS